MLKVSKSLSALGISKNDKISIYSYNRKEWNICYASAQFINAVAVGVYHTCSSNEVEWVVGNSESKVIFVGNNPGDNNEEEKMPNHRLLACIDNLEKVEKVVVLDGTVGQNAHSQLKSFDESIGLTGMIVTKLDGSAKGGVVVSLAEKYKIPIHAVGVGEGLDDLQIFEASSFSKALAGLD